MELGDPVKSELAIDVPLKLGLALLTDSRGVIDLSVPVSGDVDDPDFSLGSVIGGAIANVIIKAVTAPFRLLAGLVGSDDDLENIPFPAGKAELDEAGAKALTALAAALQQRPQLSLRIVGSSNPATDGRMLKTAMLHDMLLAEGLSEESIATRDERFRAAILERHAQLGGGEPDNPQTQGDPDITPLEDAVVTSLSLPSGALAELATQRAAAAKRELVTANGIDAARIAISFDGELTSAGVNMRVES
jgi:hypothetical protein